MTGLAQAFAAVIALCSGAGVLLASRVLEGPDKRRRHFFCYYTNLSNALMCVYHVLLLIPGGFRDRLLRPGVRLAMTLCIFVTFLIYFCVLTRFGRHQRKAMEALGTKVLSNTLVHYVTPLLTAAEWLLTADKTGLGLREALLWLLVPLAYLLFALLRSRTGVPLGKSGSLWPYPFLDLERLGPGKWLRNTALVVLVFLALGLGFVGLARAIT